MLQPDEGEAHFDFIFNHNHLSEEVRSTDSISSYDALFQILLEFGPLLSE